MSDVAMETPEQRFHNNERLQARKSRSRYPSKRRSLVAQRVSALAKETGLRLSFSKYTDTAGKRVHDRYALMIESEHVHDVGTRYSIVRLVMETKGKTAFLNALDSFIVGYNLSQATLHARIQAVMKQVMA